MKKNVLVLAIMMVPSILWGQVVTNAEDYQTGTVFKYQLCEPAGITAGGNGSGQVWNFTALSPIPDSVIGLIEHPSSTAYASIFPSANMVEKLPGGKLAFLTKSATESNLVGYIDPASNIQISYQNSRLLMKRPIALNSTFIDTFTTAFTASGYSFRGQGVAEITADAYGTLILPNGIFNNVLRVKSSFIQRDTIQQLGITSITESTTYLWYDGINNSPLLKIESTTSGSFHERSVGYLLHETRTPLGITEALKISDFIIWPNPANNQVSISTEAEGKLTILDQLGRVVKTEKITNSINHIETDRLLPGCYFLILESGKDVRVEKLTINR